MAPRARQRELKQPSSRLYRQQRACPALPVESGEDERVNDMYGSDVLSGFSRSRGAAPLPSVAATRGEVFEDDASGFTGAVVGIEGQLVQLEDRSGRVRAFPLGSTMLVDGARVKIVAPHRSAAPVARTASGSIAVADHRARVALPSRIFVEGRHDAELVERVWGADLRIEGVVVEYLEGVDDLESIIAEFAPAPGRRVGVLVDHLVAGSKESRIAETVARGKYGRHVLVVGHPFVDIWQSVKPARLGMTSWPVVPRSVEWKHGICESLGWPHATQADIARAWKRILGRVDSYADLEPVLLARVEQLIDFVTEPGA